MYPRREISRKLSLFCEIQSSSNISNTYSRCKDLLLSSSKEMMLLLNRSRLS